MQNCILDYGKTPRMTLPKMANSCGKIVEMNNKKKFINFLINGNGFLKLKNSELVAYTRNCEFFKNDEGYLEHTSGMVLDTGIKIPPNAASIKISLSGIVSITTSDTKKEKILGQISLFKFPYNKGLDRKVINEESVYLSSIKCGEALEGLPGSEHFGQIIQNFE